LTRSVRARTIIKAATPFGVDSMPPEMAIKKDEMALGKAAQQAEIALINEQMY